MSNIIDYLSWRGDLSFAAAPFNQIDNLVLSQLSYMPFELLEEFKDCCGEYNDVQVKLGDAAARLSVDPPQVLSTSHVEDDLKLLSALAVSPRFSGLTICDYINQLDIEEEKQLSAITVLSDDEVFVVFRGTGSDIIGWKEDFNLAYESEIPAQRDAVLYLNRAAERFEGRIRVLGHSKGGNLAVYSASHCNDSAAARICQVYNNDGPGMCDMELESEGYKRISGRLMTFLPQSSVVGMLLAHAESYNVVKSTGLGLLQHDAYTWECMGTQFIKEGSVRRGALIFDKTLKQWTATMTISERHILFDNLYGIIMAAEASKVQQLAASPFKSASAMLSAAKNIDPKTRKLLHSIIKELFSISAQNLIESGKKTVPQLASPERDKELVKDPR